MRFLVVWCLFTGLIWSADATLEVVKGVQPLPSLVIEDGSAVENEMSQKMHAMLSADMNVISLFTLNENYFHVPYEGGVAAANSTNSHYVLRFRLAPDGAGGVRADVKLLQNSTEIFVKTYLLKQSEMAVFLSHSIAYDINTKLGGAPLEWIKRKVLLVRLTGARRSEIVAADYTLSYQKVLLSGGMFGFAKWANGEQTDFYYTSLSDFKPTIYKMSLINGRKEKIISSDGMAICSDVNQDGTKLLMTLAPTGQPDIYLYDTETRGKIQVTDFSGIDVSGQFMSNDKIAFVSNRLGYPNIFSKAINNSSVTQLVYEGKSNSSFSAYQDNLVYKARDTSGMYEGTTFNLHLLSLRSNTLRPLTSGGENDFPRFSGDGQAVLFIKQEGARSSLGIIRLSYNKSFSFPLKVGRIQSIDW
ncbi:MAG: Tol-Pal system protein TolB [Sulfuricurvum sp.]|jgi:TolB protein|uniref:Tol-Pal system protein TolB n=1 Tax=Sulfuricurvum sp. TaxID=2025608 RepID=UPI0025F863BB|nr:Tol-Pal system protein TolB [Sulfuricurvum sp.]MCK9373835.1 Tol-Pal system protein TolB [Sulfuricurvum sp.]